MKICTKCSVAKPLTEFERHKTTRDGLHTHCRSCCAERKRAYYKANKARLDAANRARFDPVRHRSYTKANRIKLKLAALRAYGGKCACCGESAHGFLTIDHPNNDGAAHRREIGGNGRIYQWLKKRGYPAGFRVLCFNCNCAIGAFGRCPHQDNTAGDLTGQEVTKTPSAAYIAVAKEVQAWIAALERMKYTHPDVPMKGSPLNNIGNG